MDLSRLVLVALCAASCLGLAGGASSVHTVFPTECTKYFTWQSLGMMLSHRLSGQPGPLTRIMSCTHEEFNAMSEEERNICPTHVAPSYTRHPRTGDNYSAYNKPVAVIDWLARTDVKEDYVLIIDADMIMLTPFIPEEVGASRGWAVSAYFGYMKGVNNKLALKHVPDVLPRNDTRAGPRGRRGDMVGGFTLMHTQDLRRVAPMWLTFSEAVRFDDEAWTLTGDHYSTHPGDKPWISEMYGYSYAASKADVWHHVDGTAMLYPGYKVRQLPKVLHYGLKIDVPQPWSFDKHWHFDFEALMCPPWDLSAKPPRGKKGGLFPHPPDPETLTSGDAAIQLRDLLAIQTVVVLNAALCERHLKACPPSEQLTRECGTAARYLESLRRRLDAIAADMPDPCADNDSRCPGWAKSGECVANGDWMASNCPVSCKRCVPARKKGAAKGDAAAAVKAVADAAKDAVGGALAATKGAAGDAVAATKDATKEAAAIVTEAAARVADAPPVLHDTEALGVAGNALEAVAGGGDALLRTGGDGKAPAERVELLRARCMRQPHWSMGAVKACLAAAARGEEYRDPSEGGGARAQGGLGERTRRLVAGAEDEVRLVAASAVHGTGTVGFVLWIVVLVALLWTLPRVRSSLGTPSAAFAAGRGFFGLRQNKGRSE